MQSVTKMHQAHAAFGSLMPNGIATAIVVAGCAAKGAAIACMGRKPMPMLQPGGSVVDPWPMPLSGSPTPPESTGRHGTVREAVGPQCPRGRSSKSNAGGLMVESNVKEKTGVVPSC